MEGLSALCSLSPACHPSLPGQPLLPSPSPWPPPLLALGASLGLSHLREVLTSSSERNPPLTSPNSQRRLVTLGSLFLLCLDRSPRPLTPSSLLCLLIHHSYPGVPRPPVNPPAPLGPCCFSPPGFCPCFPTASSSTALLDWLLLCSRLCLSAHLLRGCYRIPPHPRAHHTVS